MNPATAYQNTYLKNARARSDSRLCKPHALDARAWMAHMVQMNHKGYIRWEGARPFISTAGRAAIEE